MSAASPRSARGPEGRPPPIWTRAYVSLGAVVFLCYLSNKAMQPLIPLYVRDLGGTEFAAGVLLAAFSIASFGLRPFVGRLVDTRGAGLVLLLGSLLLGLATAGMLVPLLAVLALANTVRGAAWAGINTGSNTLLAHLAPPSRRGEAAGYYALFPALAGTLGPPLILWWLAGGGGFSVVLLGALALGILGATLSRPLLPVRGQRPATREAGASTTDRGPLIARSTLLPSLLLIFVMFSQAAVMGFLPLYAMELGVATAGVTGFYVVNGVGSFVGRMLLGRVSDRHGRGPAVACGFALMMLALFGLVLARFVPVLLLVGVLYAFGQALAAPALTATAIDRADKRRIGAAMATFSASYQIGNGSGALAAGALIGAVGYALTYVFLGSVVGIGLVLTLVNWRELDRKGEEREEGAAQQ